MPNDAREIQRKAARYHSLLCLLNSGWSASEALRKVGGQPPSAFFSAQASAAGKNPNLARLADLLRETACLIDEGWAGPSQRTRAFYEVGRARQARGDVEGALAAYSAGGTGASGYYASQSLLELARIKARISGPASVREYMIESIAASPANCRYTVGWLVRSFRNEQSLLPPDWLQVLKPVLELNDHRVDSWAALALLNLGEREAARMVFGDTAERHREDPLVLGVLASLQAVAGEYGEARENFRKAISGAASSAAAEWAESLSRLELNVGSLEAAAAAMEVATRLNPRNPHYSKRLTDLRRKMTKSRNGQFDLDEPSKLSSDR